MDKAGDLDCSGTNLDFAISELEHLTCSGHACLTWEIDTCKDQVLAWLKELRELRANKRRASTGEKS